MTMQYFKPAGLQQFAGDCMPFFDDGTFHLFYLLDENHHQALGGLGGHQWGHATSTDLITWIQHPLAIAITNDWEYSICTGSTFFHQGLFYGFYATRMADWTQHLGLAVSEDAITFRKVEPNPLASPPKEYDPLHYRDPFVFWSEHDGRFHMLVTAMLANYPLANMGGCLAHLTSHDLLQWTVTAPFLLPGLPGAPECSDYFFWRGSYYLLFSNDLVTRYRMSRRPFGPWERPQSDILDSPALRVMKTAPFTGDRRIGAAWLGTREHEKDAGRFQWGGNVVFRELIQHDDGTLGTTFPPEMIPTAGDKLELTFQAITPQANVTQSGIELNAAQGLAAAQITGAPEHVRITAHVIPSAGAVRFGLRLRGADAFQSGYDLTFLPLERRVELFDQAITLVDGLNQPFSLDIVVKGDIIDVCVDQRRCIVNRCSELKGSELYLFSHSASVTFEQIEIRRLAEV